MTSCWILTCVVSFTLLLTSDAGQWKSFNATKGKELILSDFGYSVIDKSVVIFSLKACGSFRVTFAHKNTIKVASGFIMLIFNLNNKGTVLIPASKCTQSGNCKIGKYLDDPLLSCDTDVVFHAAWNNKGSFLLGRDTVVGKDNLLLYKNEADMFHINTIVVKSETSDGVLGLYFNNAPTIKLPSPVGNTIVTVSESVAINSSIYQVDVSDREDDVINLTIFAQHTDLFTFDGNNITTLDNLDFETKRSYHVFVKANDSTLAAYGSFTIRLQNEYDEPPLIHVPDLLTVVEELAVGSVVGTAVVVTDRDFNDTLSYRLSGSDSQYIEINTTTGVMSVKQRIDYDGDQGRHYLDDLELIVTDLGGLETNRTLNFSVVDINDNSPNCSQMIYNIQVTENSTDTYLLNMSCKDIDSGVNGEVDLSIKSGDDTDSKFYIQDEHLYAHGDKVDYEALEKTGYRYTLGIQAVDRADDYEQKVSLPVVIVEVIPVNEFTPQWTDRVTINLTVFENTTSGEILGVFLATDDDHGTDGFVSYAIQEIQNSNGNTVNGTFSVDEHGVLYLTTQLDKDTATGGVDYYTVILKAFDGGSPQKSVTRQLQISILNVNDNAPKFECYYYEVNLDETAAIGTVVADVVAVDGDGDTLTYSVVGKWSDIFECDGPAVKLKSLVNYEVQYCYTITVSVTDGQFIVNVTVTINVVNIIDETPVISLFTPLFIPEHLPVGTVVGKIFSVNDSDIDDVLTYSLTGADSRYLAINSSTGVISISEMIDFDDPANTKLLDQLQLTVLDAGGLNDSVALNFTVVDVNDNTPVFSKSIYNVNVSENTPPDTLIVELVCEDKDSGSNGQFTLTIASGDDASAKFKLDGLRLMTTSVDLDYESLENQQFVYSLIILAVDKSDSRPPNTGVTMVLIQVQPLNELAPNWISPEITGEEFTQMSVNEDTAVGTNITQFVASDGDLGRDGDVTYMLDSITTDAAAADDIFTINPLSGYLSVARPLDSDPDTGGVKWYSIVVVARDNGTPEKTSSGTMTVVIININDNPPLLTGLENKVDVHEDAVVGFVVKTLTGVDYDGDNVTIAAVDGDVSVFGMSGSDLKTSLKLDFEKRTHYSLVISISDGRFDTNYTHIINVKDVNDEYPFLQINNALTIVEELPFGFLLGGVFTATDQDAGDIINYSLTGADSDYLTINNSTGELRVQKRLDYEKLGGRFLDDMVLTVIDLAGHTVSEKLNFTVVDINDNTPVFSKAVYYTNISENDTSGLQSVLQLHCSDADAGENGQISVSILKNPDNIFSLDGLELKVDSSAINYESSNVEDFTYLVTVIAVDHPPSGQTHTGTAQILVKILPKNEFAPEWQNPSLHSPGVFSSVAVSENIAPGTNITQFAATDLDYGADGELQYTLINVTTDDGTLTNNVFVMEMETGILRTSHLLDSDLATGGCEYYTVCIMVSDKGTPAKTTEATIKIYVDNYNDNAPVLKNYEFRINVTEDVVVGDVVYTLTVVDDDGDNVTVTVVDCDTDLFHGDGYDIKVVKKLDFEYQQCHTITLGISDGKHRVNTTLTIYITDVIDESPVIQLFQPIEIYEELQAGTIIGSVYAVTDADRSDRITYKLTGADTKFLEINSTTGYISIKERIDFDAPSNITLLEDLKLTVTDLAGLETTVNVNIHILNLNDNTPRFSKPLYITELQENSTNNVEVMKFTLMDVDAGGDFNLSIISGDDANPQQKFDIVNNTLLVLNAGDIDYESLNASGYMYMLDIRATDLPEFGHSNTGYTVVMIKILARNEAEPVWQMPSLDTNTMFPAINISEETPLRTNIGTYSATDNDHGIDGEISYHIFSITADDGQNRPGMFSIHQRDGDLITSSPLDCDTATGGSRYYNIVISAVDGGSPAKSSERILQIYIFSENDNAPMFKNIPNELNIYENVSVNAIVSALTAEDVDEDDVTFSVIDGDVTYFTIVGSDISVKQKVDYESERCHTIVVSATDGKHVTNMTISISILDVIDETPQLKVLGPLTIPEELDTGTTLAGVFTVTDSDKDDILTYSISGVNSKYLKINATSGVIFVKERIDFDGSSGISSIDSVLLRVTDLGGLTATTSINFTVLDINDNSPHFERDVYVVNVTENQTEVELVHFNVSDDDAQDSGKLTLAIVHGDDAIPKFYLNGFTLVAKADIIDYEILESDFFVYKLTLHAVDTGGGIGSAVVVVQVNPTNEYSPEWLSPTPDSSGRFPNLTVTEDIASGAEITTYRALDSDLYTHGKITYHITRVSTEFGSPVVDMFFINPVTGVLVTGGGLDADSLTGGTRYFDITIRVEDGGNPILYTEGIQHVDISNVNDNAPLLSSVLQTLVVAEDTPTGTTLGNIVVVDYDNDVLTVTLTDVTGIFSLEDDKVKLNVSLDFETSPCHLLTIRATDGMHTTSLSLSVNVTDVNDERPVITTARSYSMVEELAVGTLLREVFTVSDTDKDDVLSYVLTGSDTDFVKIGTDTGSLQITKRIDYDDAGGKAFLDNLTLAVTDGAGHEVSTMLNITIIDLNDNNPQFAQPIYRVNLTEATTSGTILVIDCTDDDSGSNGDISYNVTSGGQATDVFTLDGHRLRVNGSKLDYEVLNTLEYILVVEAVDKPASGSSLTGTAVVIISVLQLNEFTPQWSEGNTTFPDLTVSEVISPGSNITMFSATDSDAGSDGFLSYSIVSIIDNNGKSGRDKFILNSQTGLLQVVQQLDKDAKTGGVDFYTIVVQAVDHGASEQRRIEGTVKLSLSAENDNVPSFTQSFYVVELAEDTVVGTVITTLSAVDVDEEDDLVFNITESDVLQIQGNNVTIVKMLDFEKDACFTVNISVSDGHHTTYTSLTVTLIDVIDEPPEIIMSDKLTLLEELPIGTAVNAFFSVFDKDQHDNLTFSLAGAHSSYLAIDPSGGQLTVQRRIDTDTPSGLLFLDQLTLTVTDSVGLTATSVLNISVIDVNDNNPQCYNISAEVSLLENTTIGTVIIELACSDIDSGGNEELAVTLSGVNISQYFNVSGTRIVVIKELDYESVFHHSSSFMMLIQVTDSPRHGHSLSWMKSVEIKILPVNEMSPEWSSPLTDSSGLFSNMSVSETVRPGATIVNFLATDGDAGVDGDVLYELVSVISDSGRNASAMFTLDKYSGSLSSAAALDADVATGGAVYYDISIRSNDGGDPVHTVSGEMRLSVLNANDNQPFWNSVFYETQVYENTSAGSVVLNISATDHDADELFYTVVGGDESMFQLNGTQLVLTQMLDFEAVQCHSIVISVSDGEHMVNTSVQIHVLDVNDQTPTISVTSSLTLPEELPLGTDISGLFSVSDADSNDVLQLSLTGEYASYLSINQSHGLLTIRKRIDRDLPNSVLLLAGLNLEVKDSVGNTHSVSFNITIDDVNDNPPTFSNHSYITQVNENSAEDTFLLNFTCTDLDSGNNGKFHLTISSGNTDGAFYMKNNSLFVNGSLVDYDVMPAQGFTYHINVKATDTPDNGQARSGHTTVSVQVLPQNEFMPVWTTSFSNKTVSEHVSPGYSVTTCVASDDDKGSDGLVTYDIIYVRAEGVRNVSGHFTIDSMSGKITTLTTLDVDVATGGVPYYDITVRAKDGGKPPKAIEKNLKIILRNYNDNAPRFSDNVYTVIVTCSIPVGSSIVQLDASDQDGDSDLVYELKDSTGYFSIITSTGAMVLARRADKEGLVEQTVVVKDRGTPELTGTVVVVAHLHPCTNRTKPITKGTTSPQSADCLDGGYSNPIEEWTLRIALCVVGLMFVSSLAIYLRKYLFGIGRVMNTPPIKVSNGIERPIDEGPTLHIDKMGFPVLPGKE